jgi:hypothetical protein
VFVIVQVLDGLVGLIDVRVAVVMVFVVVQHVGIMLGQVLSHVLETVSGLARHHMCERAFCRGNRLPGKYDQQDEEQRLLHEVGRW